MLGTFPSAEALGYYRNAPPGLILAVPPATPKNWYSQVFCRRSRVLQLYSVAPIRFCQCYQANQMIPAASKAPMTASNWWKYFPSSRQFSPSFIPNHANPKHQGHDPRKV